jgi:hypothetical protein
MIHGYLKSTIYSNLQMTGGSATDDADDAFPWTPNSKKSDVKCRIANSPVGAEFPTASRSPGTQYSDTFLIHTRASSSEGRHALDKLMNDITHEGTSESIDPEVGPNLMSTS